MTEFISRDTLQRKHTFVANEDYFEAPDKKKIRAVIIGEGNAQILLTSMVCEYCPSLELVGIASSYNEGLNLIRTKSVELVFLDTHLGIESGFDVLDQFPSRDFNVVITSSDVDFAMKAFKYEAIDYILKPYRPKAIIQAVEKVMLLLNSMQIKKKITQDLHPVIVLNTHDGITFLDESSIIYCCADGSYCTVYTKNDGKIMISKPLCDLESQLNPDKFFRVHTSHLINISHARKYVKKDGGFLVMSDGSEIPVSRRKKQEFLERVV